jgi:hypothetical protein
MILGQKNVKKQSRLVKGKHQYNKLPATTLLPSTSGGTWRSCSRGRKSSNEKEQKPSLLPFACVLGATPTMLHFLL